MTRKKSVENLSPTDERILSGFREIEYEEEEQIIPPFVEEVVAEIPEEKNLDDLNNLRNRSEVLLERITRLKDEIDGRCKELNVKIVEDESGDNELLKAMWRVFGQRTTTITYSHYKRALELREQLAREDEVKLRNS